MISFSDLNAHREDGCTATLADKKYYIVDNSCIKRTLRQHEWTTTPGGILVVPPTTYPHRWKTDALILKHLSKHTNIPLPEFQCTFEDDGAFYHSTKYVPGVAMSELSEAEVQIVTKELLQHVATLKSLRSDQPGIPGQDLLCPPQRISQKGWKRNSCWRLKSSMDNLQKDFVFCHNDLGQHNILVDPKTLKINAIIDWEFGGFWPEWFERPYWERSGPSGPLEGELNDIERCRAWLMEHCDEVPIPHLKGLLEKLKDAENVATVP